jgi:hypothetical protein
VVPDFRRAGAWPLEPSNITQSLSNDFSVLYTSRLPVPCISWFCLHETVRLLTRAQPPLPTPNNPTLTRHARSRL